MKPRVNAERRKVSPIPQDGSILGQIEEKRSGLRRKEQGKSKRELKSPQES